MGKRKQVVDSESDSDASFGSAADNKDSADDESFASESEGEAEAEPKDDLIDSDDSPIGSSGKKKAAGARKAGASISESKKRSSTPSKTKVQAKAAVNRKTVIDDSSDDDFVKPARKPPNKRAKQSQSDNADVDVEEKAVEPSAAGNNKRALSPVSVKTSSTISSSSSKKSSPKTSPKASPKASPKQAKKNSPPSKNINSNGNGSSSSSTSRTNSNSILPAVAVQPVPVNVRVEVDITRGPPVPTESGAKKLILAYLKQQNRPYSCIQIFDNLHKRIIKGTVEKVCDALAKTPDSGVLLKEYGKTKLYFPDQKGLEGASSAKLDQLDKQIQGQGQDVQQREQAMKALQREVSQIKSQPTDASLDAVLAETEARVAVLETKSAAISGAKLDPQALEHAKAKHNFYRAKWVERRRAVTEFVDNIADSMEKKTAVMCADMGVETDKDVNVTEIPKPIP